MDPAQRGREAAAQHAAALVEDGMVVGLGTGRTAAAFVRALAARVRQGLHVLGIPTSTATERLARAEGIPIVTLESHPRPDLDVDGADAVDPALNLIKGHGGALLYEKIVALASNRFVVIVDEGKLVPSLDRGPAIPVEVVPFGWSRTQESLQALGATVSCRRNRNGTNVPFVTDSGHYLLDCHFTNLSDPAHLAMQIKSLTGVVDHGLFIGMASQVIVGNSDGSVRVLTQTG